VTEIIFAVLFVSLMGLTRCYKTTVFLHLYQTSHRHACTNRASQRYQCTASTLAANMHTECHGLRDTSWHPYNLVSPRQKFVTPPNALRRPGLGLALVTASIIHISTVGGRGPSASSNHDTLLWSRLNQNLQLLGLNLRHLMYYYYYY